MNEQSNDTLTECVQETPVETAPQTKADVAPVNSNPMFRDAGSTAARRQKPTHIPSLVLGILSIIFWLFIVLIGEILGIIGICLAAKNRLEYNTAPGLVCSIIGLSLSVLTHIINVIILLGA
jgi:hypothetical protein